MLPVGFEPTMSAGERPKTYALDRAATWAISKYKNKTHIYNKSMERNVKEGDEGAEGSQHCAYSCISLLPLVANISHSKALVRREGYRD